MNLTTRKCGICETADNPIMGSESPCAFWGSRPWMPEAVYTLARCRTCGTLYVDSDVTEEYLTSLQAEFCPDVKYSEYESILRASEFVVNWQMMKNCRRPTQGDKLLDFGCSLVILERYHKRMEFSQMVLNWWPRLFNTLSKHGGGVNQ